MPLARGLKAVAAALGGLALLLPTAAPAEASPRNAARIDAQVQFLADRQLPSGAIMTSDTAIVPYFANIGALGLAAANTPESRCVLYQWMSWYLDHMETPDASGLVGTVYDYSVDPATGVETPTNDYDSADSYAATSLDVAYRAYLTGDRKLQALVRANVSRYDQMADLLIKPVGEGGLRTPQNLTIAKPSYPIEYLMDNAEVVSGLRGYARLKRLLGAKDWKTYARWADATAEAVAEHLWNEQNQTWDWALRNPSDPNSAFYPQGVAQFWPALWGVVPPNRDLARTSWRTFTQAWPGWRAGDVPDSFPWVSMAVAAQTMKDRSGAAELLRAVETNFAPEWRAPRTCGATVCGNWYAAEAGWMLLALTKTRL